MPIRLNRADKNFEAEFESLLKMKRGQMADVAKTVADIIATIRAHGDKALIDLTAKLDGFDVTLDGLCVRADEIEAAEANCDRQTLEALNMAAARITDFHTRQKPTDDEYTDEVGMRLGYRWQAVAAAGLYVPGGTANYPSSVLMNALPAKIAGVKRLVMVVPCPQGEMNPLVLAAARRAGIDEIYRIGGAQAIAALAYGTQTIAPVNMIVGPGNAYVTEAKRQVFGQVGIDMLAGPTEILIVADSTNEPSWIAADLLAQAEHDIAAQSILLTDDARFADAVIAQVEAQLKTLPRANIAGASWQNCGAVIEVADIMTQAPPLIDRLAAEHVALAIDAPDALLAKIQNGGAFFLGRYTPEAIGDYIAGPSHVLPTNRSARYASGLSVLNFMKRSTLMQANIESLNALAPSAIKLAEAEKLSAHARSIAIRLNRKNGEAK